MCLHSQFTVPIYPFIGDFFAAEKYGFTLYPVFADGEGELAYSTGKLSSIASILALYRLHNIGGCEPSTAATSVSEIIH